MMGSGEGGRYQAQGLQTGGDVYRGKQEVEIGGEETSRLLLYENGLGWVLWLEEGGAPADERGAFRRGENHQIARRIQKGSQMCSRRPTPLLL